MPNFNLKWGKKKKKKYQRVKTRREWRECTGPFGTCFQFLSNITHIFTHKHF